MCYQGTITTTTAQTIILSKKSLSNFTLQKCQAATTAEPKPELMTTTADMLTTINNDQSTLSSTEIPEADSTTTNVMINSTGMTPVSQNLSTTDFPRTTNSSSEVTIPQNKTDVNEATATPESRRRRQDGDELTDHEPSNDRNFTCQAFYYLNSKDNTLQFNSTYTLEFSCVTEETEELCEGKEKVDNQTIGNHIGTRYCCNGSACISPLNITSDNKVTVETLKNCSSYNQEGKFQSVPCVGTQTHMCLEVRDMKSNITEYTCGNMKSEGLFCIKDNWYSEQCQDSDGKEYCCYVEPTFVKVPPEEKPPNSSVGIIIGIIVAFATGLFLGCVGLVILQKKCGKGRTSGIEMDFSYSRFQSADSGTDEL
ncbi:hypothetical protein HOLleu_33632 [Holothuria leucospilota]|uniref:Uncharacterized protein n=1 Tax=Holothuria leucospilota TaxID=206669 RepID=A0A9Q1BFK4_HOLLE|nr:hypothetical protein HOLleu_33632 [Holothuria leucospilota]